MHLNHATTALVVDISCQPMGEDVELETTLLVVEVDTDITPLMVVVVVTEAEVANPILIIISKGIDNGNRI